MSNESDNIRNLFQSRFRDLEITPPAETWGKVNMRLRRNKKVVFWRYSVAATVLLLITASLFFLRPILPVQKSAEKQAVEELKPAVVQVTPDPVQPSYAEGNVQQTPSIISVSAVEDQAITTTTPQLENFTSTTELTIEKPYTEQLAVETARSADYPADSVAKPHYIPQFDNNENLRINGYLPDLPLLEPQRWTIALGYGTNPQLPETAFESSFTPSRAAADLENNFTDFLDNTTSAENIATREHHIPVSFALTLTRRITQRINFEGGLSITRLRSVNSTFPISGQHNAYESTLYYLGFPAGVRFDVVKTGRLSFYILQSIVVEKGVLAQHDTYRFTGNILTGNENRSGSVDGIQLSSLTGAGAAVRIINPISVYIQSGFQVFLLNHTQPYTIRNERAIWPSVHTGLRFHL